MYGIVAVVTGPELMLVSVVSSVTVCIPSNKVSAVVDFTIGNPRSYLLIVNGSSLRDKILPVMFYS